MLKCDLDSLGQMGLTKKDDGASAHPMYYKENNTPLRETRFFLKPVQATTAKGKLTLYRTGVFGLTI